MHYGRAENFDGILIETTGLADPGPVIQTFFVDDDLRECVTDLGMVAKGLVVRMARDAASQASTKRRRVEAAASTLPAASMSAPPASPATNWLQQRNAPQLLALMGPEANVLQVALI